MNNEDGVEANHDGEKVNMTENSDIKDLKVKDSQMSNKPLEINLVGSKLDSKNIYSKIDPKPSNIANSNIKMNDIDIINSKNSQVNSKSAKPIEESKFSKENKKSIFGKTADIKNEIIKDSKVDEKMNSKINDNEKKNQDNNSQASNSKKPGENGVNNNDIKLGEKDKNVKVKVEEKKNENIEDFENQRTQKLMNSKDNNRKIVVIQFAFIALLFITYFIVDFVLELQYLNVIRQSYSHLKLISQRTPIVKYTVVFTVEQLATATIQLQNSLVFTNGTFIDVRNYYTNFLYDNERDIFESMTQSFPSEFTSYLTTFELYNYEDLCQNYYSVMTTQDLTNSN